MDKIQEIFGFHIIALIVSSSEVLGLSLDPIRLIWQKNLTGICSWTTPHWRLTAISAQMFLIFSLRRSPVHLKNLLRINGYNIKSTYLIWEVMIDYSKGKFIDFFVFVLLKEFDFV